MSISVERAVCRENSAGANPARRNFYSGALSGSICSVVVDETMQVNGIVSRLQDLHLPLPACVEEASLLGYVPCLGRPQSCCAENAWVKLETRVNLQRTLARVEVCVKGIVYEYDAIAGPALRLSVFNVQLSV